MRFSNSKRLTDDKNIGIIFRLICMLVAAVGLYFARIWKIEYLIVWFLVYAASDILSAVYYHNNQNLLVFGSSGDQAKAGRRLTLLTATASTLAVLPLYATPGHGVATALAAIVASCGAIMLYSAQHSINRFMIVLTLPPVAGALLVNIYFLAPVDTRPFMMLVGILFVSMSLIIQYSIAAAVRDLVRAKNDAEAAGKAKMLFLSGMSHEIRTPLNSVIGMAEAAKMERRPKARQFQIEQILHAARTLENSIDQLILYANEGVRPNAINNEVVNLKTIILECLDAFQFEIDEKGLDVATGIDDGSCLFEGDKEILKFLVRSAISNAVKFTEAGTISVSVRRLTDGVAIDVCDTGIGIPTDETDMVFEPFQKGTQSPTNCAQGVGLGLTLARGIVEELGGTIRLSPNVDSGATLSITLPLRAVESTAPPIPMDESAQPQKSLDELRILVAEDNLQNQMMLRAILSHITSECVIVDNGLSAFEACRDVCFDLIIMDLNMPVMDGYESVRKIRELEADAHRRPSKILAYTADALACDNALLAAAGLDGFLKKPIEIKEIFSVLEAVAGAEDES